jgi:hypothetical protein
MQKTERFIVLTVMLLFAASTYAQKKVDSPFARYGIGNLENQGTFRTRAMGGVSSGIRNSVTLNYLTPASYSSIDTASFIFDFGIDGAVVGLTEGDVSYKSTDINFTHLLIGFPIMKNWGFSAGVIPYTDGYYEMTETTTPDAGGEIAGEVVEYHKGLGGYQKFYLGTGVSPFKYVSFGANMYVLFGEINRYNDFIFSEDNNYFNMRELENTGIRGIGIDASAQFILPLPDKKFINAGITWSPGKNFNTSYDQLFLRYSNVQTSSLAFDTLYYGQNDTVSFIPSTVRAGLSFGKEDKLTVGFDLVWSKWSAGELPGSYGTYSDALSLHAGVEYIPEKYSNYNFFDRVEYRMGCRYGESYALFANTQVKEYGITFGAGIPLRKSRSRASLFIDLSRRGNPEDIQFRETRISVGASLNLFDYWFLKAKYE